MPEPLRVVIFCHSLRSDWNHGNAHFLRGIARELVSRGYDLSVQEPADGWSAANLAADHGPAALSDWRNAYPMLGTHCYTTDDLDLDAVLDGAALVLVHEWNDPSLVARIGAHRVARGRYALLFHDTHHRLVSNPDAMKAFDLDGYDGVLAFGEVLRDAYLRLGWARRAFTWHEAADIAHFHPPSARPKAVRDLVWVGNWGDDERSAELGEFLVQPVEALRLDARIHGVRYSGEARGALAAAGIEYVGYLPNDRVPHAFGEASMTVHVPRRPYARLLPGIPTIRVFEALACGIPLVSAPWDDAEGLFSPGQDYLFAQDGAAMRLHMRTILNDRGGALAMANKGWATIQARHTCAHRVDELVMICRRLGHEIAPQQLAEA